jgi:hypothetical protein
MWGWICAGLAGVALVAFLLWTISRSRLYWRLFSDEHFQEVAAGVARLKAAALEKVVVSPADEISSPEDPRVRISKSGLVVVYTVRQAAEKFIHHFSVSVGGGYTARAVGGTFLLFVTRLLEVPFEKSALGVGRSTVHHGEFHLDAAEQTAFAGKPVRSVSLAEINDLRGELLEASKRLPWQQVD